MGNTKTIRMSDGTRSDDLKPYREGHVDVTVSVPVEKFENTLNDATTTGWIEPSIVAEEGWQEDDLRVALATFSAVMETLPMLTTDFTKMLLVTGCRNTVRDVVAREFDLVESIAA